MLPRGDFLFGLFLKRQVFFFLEPKGFSMNITEAQASRHVKKQLIFLLVEQQYRRLCVVVRNTP